MVAPGPKTPWYQHKRSKAFQGQELLNVSSPDRMLMLKLIPKRWGYNVCLIYIYTYVCMHACMHAWMDGCMYVWDINEIYNYPMLRWEDYGIYIYI
jgi:hypothetical protein